MKNKFGVGEQVNYKGKTVTIKNVGITNDGRVYYYDMNDDSFWESDIKADLPKKMVLLKSYLIKKEDDSIYLTGWTTWEHYKFLSPDDELLDTREKYIEY